MDAYDDRFGYCYPAAGSASAPPRPLADIDPPIVTTRQMESWSDLFGPGYSASAHVTADRAMRHSAVFACVRVLAGAISTLPLKVYRQKKGTPTHDRTHKLSPLLRLRPNPRMSAAMFWRAITAEAVLNGNGYAWIERSRNGDPLALWPTPHGRVSPRLLQDRSVAYVVTLDGGAQIAVPADDMLHLPGSTQWDGLRALSPLRAAATSIGLGLEADDFALRFFENSAVPGGYLTYEKTLKPETVEQLRTYWNERFSGAKRGSLAILTDGGEFKPLSLNMEDAQLLETRRFQTEDIARIFGVPPHMIGALDKTTSWGSGIEQQAIGFITYSLQPHLTAFEQEIEAKLFDNDGAWAEFDVRGLMRGDFVARTNGYKAALGGPGAQGFMTVNEVRALENLAPVDGGDEVIMSARAGEAAPPEPPPEPPADPATEETTPPPGDAAQTKKTPRRRRQS